VRSVAKPRNSIFTVLARQHAQKRRVRTKHRILRLTDETSRLPHTELCRCTAKKSKDYSKKKKKKKKKKKQKEDKYAVSEAPFDKTEALPSTLRHNDSFRMTKTREAIENTHVEIESRQSDCTEKQKRKQSHFDSDSYHNSQTTLSLSTSYEGSKTG
jgi:hypothetical protein